MATKQQVLDLHRQHPGWTSGQFAQKLECDSAYVRATFRRNGLKLARAPGKSELVELGQACIAAGLTLVDLQKIQQEKAHGKRQ